MVPVVRISDRTMDRLKSNARPFDDTPDDVIGRALDALDRSSGASKPAPSKPPAPPKSQRGAKLHQSEYRQPIIDVLSEFGGGANVRDIRSRLGEILKSKLSAHDFEEVTSGDPRWWNTACWERNAMVTEGILKSNSPRGKWELKSPQPKRPETIESEIDSNANSVTWRDDVYAVLIAKDRGHGMSLEDIYVAVHERRQASGRSLPKNLDAVVRKTLEENSSDSDSFKGRNLFRIVRNKGDGIWRIRDQI